MQVKNNAGTTGVAFRSFLVLAYYRRALEECQGRFGSSGMLVTSYPKEGLL